MPSASQAGRGRSARSPGVTKSGRASARPDDAVSALMRDHRKVEDLFKQYEAAKADPLRKQKVFEGLDAELKVHTAIEEEVFYPASREYLADEEMVNEAVVEHAAVKSLLAQLQDMRPDDPYYDAKVKVLQEMVEHHVKEEESEYFPECRRSDMDLKAIGDQMMALRSKLIGGGH